MDTKDKASIQDLFNQSSKNLEDLENEIRKYFNTPSENIDLQKFKLLQFPKYYIRKKEYYVQTYNLDDVIDDDIIRDNIAYALMQSDLYNYLLNRFSFWGPIKALLIKTAVTNIASIIEAILISTLKHHHLECKISGKICLHHNKCEVYVKSPNDYSYNRVMAEFEEQFLPKSSEIISEINKLKDIRNSIHLTLLKENVFKSDKYEIETYNEAIMTLNFFRTNIQKLIEGFRKRRSVSCKMGL